MAEENEAAALAVLGGGTMAQAIIRGAVDGGAIGAGVIVVGDPDPVKRAEFAELGIEAVANFAELHDRIGPSTQVLLSVKPQVLPEAVESVIAAAGGDSRVVISVLAGTPGSRIRGLLGEWARVVRVMPNTPAKIGKGVSAIVLSEGSEPGDDDLARSLMSAVGDVVDVAEELFDAFTAVAGSGPAYVFYLAEALTRAAVELGLGDATADRVVRGLLTGSAGLLEREGNVSARELRAAVTSTGGTTFAATESLDRDGVMGAVVRAVTAARDRGRELGG